jgi:hypothetical protein
MRLEARRVTARCEMMNCLAKQIATEVGGFCMRSRSFSRYKWAISAEKNRTTKAQGFCTPIPPRPAYPSRQKRRRIHLPAWTCRCGSQMKSARCQRLSVRVGAMVAELSF